MNLVLKHITGPLPISEFELVDGTDAIGKLQLRHRPSKSPSFPIGFENHIYYEVYPDHRNKGYGAKILSLGLAEAKKIGLSEAIVVCTEDNIASKKIIEKNGGELVDAQPNAGGVKVLKYRISV